MTDQKRVTCSLMQNICKWSQLPRPVQLAHLAAVGCTQQTTVGGPLRAARLGTPFFAAEPALPGKPFAAAEPALPSEPFATAGAVLRRITVVECISR